MEGSAVMASAVGFKRALGNAHHLGEVLQDGIVATSAANPNKQVLRIGDDKVENLRGDGASIGLLYMVRL